jgi:Leucine-rich repeat (LRR) protein
LANLTNLTDLKLPGNKITSIDVLANMTDLTMLELYSNRVNDLTPLAKLANLDYLHLSKNRISDISPLANLIWLKKLYLNTNQINDISPLTNLTNLTDLGLHDNKITSIDVLANMNGLTELVLYSNRVSDLTPLAELTNLDYLHLLNNQISDISPLANLIWLERLYLNTNQINDISPLTNLTNLTDLKLPGNKITSIDVLANMNGLTELVLHNNRVSDLTPLAGLTNLDYLHLSNNRISDISPLVKNEGIQGHIWLKNNPLSKVSALTHLSAIQARGVNIEHNATLPKGVIINGGNVQDGIKTVDPTTLSSKGVILEFSDKVTRGTVELKAKEGRVLKTLANWGDNQLALTLAEGETFSYQTTYTITLIGVKGQDDRNLDGNRITFTTATKEELVESVTSQPPLPLSHASYTLNLKTGLNMISLPVKPDQAVTSKTLARDLAATVILRLDRDSQKFIPFVPEQYEGTNFEITGGMGIIVNVREEKAHTFTGTIWSNIPVAAPSISSNPVWAFTVLFEGQALDHSQLSVTNLSRGISFSTQLDDSCQMGTASAVDSSQQSVINTGDLIQVKTDGHRWQYRVTDEDLANAFANLTLNVDLRVPDQTQLLQNYPNPFNPETWIPFELASDTEVTVSIYDVQGKPVRQLQLGLMMAGKYVGVDRAIHWDGKTESGESVASGTYFYQIDAGDYRATRKMVILK